MSTSLHGDIPPQREERWARLDALLTRWFPTPPDRSGLAGEAIDAAEGKLGAALPLALREWYQRYGGRRDVWSLQDTLLLPHELMVKQGVLIFVREAQCVVEWGVRLEDLDAEDPPVVVSDCSDRESWCVECPDVSTFALAFALMNVKFSDLPRWRANGQATDEAVLAIERRYGRVRVPDLSWPALPTRFYGENELLIEVGAETWIWATGLSGGPMAELDALVRGAGMSWEQRDD